MNEVPLISRGLSGISNINASGDITGQTIQSSTGSFFSGITSNIQTQINNIKSQFGIPGSQGQQGNVGAMGATGATGSQGIQGNMGLTGSQGTQGNIGIQGVQGVQGVQGSRGNQGDTGSTGQTGKIQSGVDIASLILSSTSVLASMIAGLGITFLHSQIAAILVTIGEIETVDGTQTIQLNTLNSDMWFLTSYMTSIGVRKTDFTENQTIVSDSVLCVRDFLSKTILRVDGPNHTTTVACPLDITYDGSTSLTSTNSSVDVNGTFTHTGKTSTLSSYVSVIQVWKYQL